MDYISKTNNGAIDIFFHSSMFHNANVNIIKKYFHKVQVKGFLITLLLLQNYNKSQKNIVSIL